MWSGRSSRGSSATCARPRPRWSPIARPASRARIQAVFALSYLETALLVLVGAVWLGMAAASAISGAGGAAGAGRRPGRRRRPDAPGSTSDSDPEEIAVLSRAFNRMTRDLQAQQEALRAAHEEAESRRQFIETVLPGSAPA